MDNPCKDCPDRTKDCHTKCNKYRAFRKENIRINKLKNKEKALDAVGAEAHITRKRRNDSSVFRTHRK